MRVTLTRQLSRAGSDFKAADREGKEQGRACGGRAADSPSRSVALAAANPPGSVPKPPTRGLRGAGVTSDGVSVVGWMGRGVPTNSIKKRRKKGDETEKCTMGKTHVKPHSSTLLCD